MIFILFQLTNQMRDIDMTFWMTLNSNDEWMITTWPTNGHTLVVVKLPQQMKILNLKLKRIHFLTLLTLLIFIHIEWFIYYSLYLDIYFVNCK